MEARCPRGGAAMALAERQAVAWSAVGVAREWWAMRAAPALGGEGKWRIAPMIPALATVEQRWAPPATPGPAARRKRRAALAILAARVRVLAPAALRGDRPRR
jgi:hypothetical protein